MNQIMKLIKFIIGAFMWRVDRAKRGGKKHEFKKKGRSSLVVSGARGVSRRW